MTTDLTHFKEELEDALNDLDGLQADLPRLVSLFLKHEEEVRRAASAVQEYHVLLEALEDAKRRRAELLSVLEQHSADIEATAAYADMRRKQIEFEKDRLKQPEYEFADEAGLES